MSTKQDQFRRYFRDYLNEHGVSQVDLDRAAGWLMNTGRWEPEHSDLIRQCKTQLASALRNHSFTDPQGRNVRMYHCVVRKAEGKQLSIWGDMRDVSRTHMAKSLKQRRKQIVGDCSRLKADTDSFNDNFNSGPAIQLCLDFTKDVEELALARHVVANQKTTRRREVRPQLPGSPTPPAVNTAS